jgi:hypothetical protein
MQPSLRTLLARVVDYAGLFPPARLPLAKAVQQYAAHRAEGESWMLARFVCPADRLDELDAAVGELFSDGPPLLLAALGGGGDDDEAFREAVGRDAEALERFAARHRRRAAADQYEVRLPAGAVASRKAVAALALDCGERLSSRGRGHVLVALEAPVAGAPPSLAANAAAGISAANGGRPPGASWTACLKVRCGGLDAAAFPSAAELAAVLAIARDDGVLLKATQGLHHPLPRVDAATGARMHGFVNLLVAVALALSHGADVGELSAVLEDDDPGAFVFDGDELRWRERRLGLEALAAARRWGLASFGSCSFAEPRDDLRALGLLE